MLRIVPVAVAVALALGLAACPSTPPGPSTSPTPEPTPTPAPDPTPTPTPDPTPTPAPTAELAGTDACTTDADCVVTNFAGCCACPGCDQGAPTARSTTELAAAQKQCQVVRCNMARCKAMLCKPGESASAFAAACQNNVCVGVRK